MRQKARQLVLLRVAATADATAAAAVTCRVRRAGAACQATANRQHPGLRRIAQARLGAALVDDLDGRRAAARDRHGDHESLRIDLLRSEVAVLVRHAGRQFRRAEDGIRVGRRDAQPVAVQVVALGDRKTQFSAAGRAEHGLDPEGVVDRQEALVAVALAVLDQAVER